MGYPYDLYNSVDNNKLQTVNQLTYYNKLGAGLGVGSLTTLSTTPGVVDHIVFNGTGMFNFTVSDGSNVVAQVALNQTNTGVTNLPLNAKTTNGLAIASVASLAAAADFTVLYR